MSFVAIEWDHRRSKAHTAQSPVKFNVTPANRCRKKFDGFPRKVIEIENYRFEGRLLQRAVHPLMTSAARWSWCKMSSTTS